MLGEILDLFLADTPSLLVTIREAIKAEDAAMLKYAAHSLKGSASNLGIRKMYYLCFTLQELGSQGFFLKAAQALAELEAEFSRVKSILEAYKK